MLATKFSVYIVQCELYFIAYFAYSFNFVRSAIFKMVNFICNEFIAKLINYLRFITIYII